MCNPGVVSGGGDCYVYVVRCNSCGSHMVSSGDLGFLQLIGVIAAIVVVSTLDASATWAVPVVKVIYISQYCFS